MEDFKFLSFARKAGKIIDMCKCYPKQKMQAKIYAKQPATDALKTTSKKLIQITAKTTSGSIGNKVPDVAVKSFDEKLQVLHRKVIQTLLHK